MRYDWLLGLLLFACTQETDLAHPSHQIQPVLNGILHPDSAIAVSLTLSRSLDQSSSFAVIDNADIWLYDNDELVGLGEHTGGGMYTWDYYPVVNHTYRVEASVEGQPNIWAVDHIPPAPVILSGNYCDASGSPNTLTFSIDNPSDTTVIWLSGYYVFYETVKDSNNRSIFPFVYDTTQTFREPFGFYQSKTPPIFFDDFNRSYLNFEDAYEFAYYLRMDDELLGEAPFNFEIDYNQSRPFGIQDDTTGVYVTITQVSTQYDRYWKSSLIHYLNTDLGDEPDPLSAPVRIYSNVSNGLGIFAGSNSVSMKLEEVPCDGE